MNFRDSYQKDRKMTLPKYQNPLFGSMGKLKVTRHYVQLSKIPEMKSISKPRLPIEIYTIC